MDKIAPLWIYPINEQVVTRVNMAIHLEAHVFTGAPQHVHHYSRPVKNVDVVVASRQTKERVPYPSRLIRCSFQYDTADAILVLELPLPCRRALLPGPMHAIKAPKHTRELAHSVDLHLPLKI